MRSSLAWTYRGLVDKIHRIRAEERISNEYLMYLRSKFPGYQHEDLEKREVQEEVARKVSDNVFGLVFDQIEIASDYKCGGYTVAGEVLVVKPYFLKAVEEALESAYLTGYIEAMGDKQSGDLNMSKWDVANVTPQQIRELRISKGLSVDDAASYVNVKRRAWQRYESVDAGRQIPKTIWELFLFKTGCLPVTQHEMEQRNDRD